MKHSMVLVCLLAGGCVTTATDLPYTPASAPFAQPSPTIASVSVTDARDEKDPTYIGAIRGGYGNPLKTITTKQPISDEVRAAFTSALTQRRMLGPQGRDVLSVRVTKLSANQYVKRDASAGFAFALQDAGGRQIYADTVDIERSNGSFFDNGIFASTADLHSLMVQTMSEAIDKALDKPGLLAVLRPGS